MNECYIEFCQYIEHADDGDLLADYTAYLIAAQTGEDLRAEMVRLLKDQCYARKLPVGRVDSWLVDRNAELRADPEGFVERARQEHLRRGLDKTRQQEQQNAARQRKRPRLLPASAFAPEQAEYLIRPYLPRGMLSILGGVSAAGKTSLALDIAAAVSAGRPLPFDEDTSEKEPGVVFYLTAENDPNKVLRPRAEAMGASLDRLYFQEGASLTMSDPELETLCRSYRPALLVFDPIQSFLGPGVQMNRAEQVRPLMDKLIALAKELDMAVLLISHMSKPGPGVCSALDRLLGSSDFRNSARSILIAGAALDAPGLRVFAHGKNSLGLPGDSQLYHIDPAGTVGYNGPSDLTADRILNAAPDTGPNRRQAATLNEAVRALDELVGFVGWTDLSDVRKIAAEKNISFTTMRRARDVLKLNVLRMGMQPSQKIFWCRSDQPEESLRADILNQNEQLRLGTQKLVVPDKSRYKKTTTTKLGRCGSERDIITS